MSEAPKSYPYTKPESSNPTGYPYNKPPSDPKISAPRIARNPVEEQLKWIQDFSKQMFNVKADNKQFWQVAYMRNTMLFSVGLLGAVWAYDAAKRQRSSTSKSTPDGE